MSFLYIFAKPLALLTRGVYTLIDNYGATLIIVTVLIRLLTLPLTIISQKNTAKTQLIQPELQKLQNKYKNDRDKLALEMQKLYKKHDVNPMGGCFPLIIQMFVLFGFIRVVYDPLTYILKLSVEQIDKIKAALGVSGHVYQVTLCGIEGAKEKIMEVAGRTINFDFFGIDLTKMPKGNEADILVWVFPVLAVLATLLSSYISKKQMPQTGGADDQAQSMSNSMMTIMPIMTAFFTYTMPTGMSLYWFISTAVQLIQQTVITKVIDKKVKGNTPLSERKDKK